MFEHLFKVLFRVVESVDRENSSSVTSSILNTDVFILKDVLANLFDLGIFVVAAEPRNKLRDLFKVHLPLLLILEYGQHLYSVLKQQFFGSFLELFSGGVISVGVGIHLFSQLN